MKLTAADCRERLEVAQFGVLGTVDPERGTHLVPVVFAVEGDELVVPIDNVKPKSPHSLRRVTNLERDCRSTLLVDHRNDDWDALWWVRVDMVHAGADDPGTVWIERLGGKYPQYATAGTVRSLLRFTIDGLTGWRAR